MTRADYLQPAPPHEPQIMYPPAQPHGMLSVTYSTLPSQSTREWLWVWEPAP
jgi:hypothetical protein